VIEVFEPDAMLIFCEGTDQNLRWCAPARCHSIGSIIKLTTISSHGQDGNSISQGIPMHAVIQIAITNRYIATF